MNDEDGYYDFDQQNDDIDALIGPQGPTERGIYREHEEAQIIEEDGYGEPDEDLVIEDVGNVQKYSGDDEKLTQYRSAKYSDNDIKKLNKIAKAYGLNDSEALRMCVKIAWDSRGDEIEQLVKEVEKFERRMKKIRSH